MFFDASALVAATGRSIGGPFHSPRSLPEPHHKAVASRRVALEAQPNIGSKFGTEGMLRFGPGPTAFSLSTEACSRPGSFRHSRF